MSILVGKHIRTKLFESPLAEKVGGRIFLDGLNRDTICPYVIYSYSVSKGDETKDGDMDVCQVSVYVYSRNGEESLELANDIRKALDNTSGDYGDFGVLNTTFESYRGVWNAGEYERELNFNIKTY